MIDNLFKDSFMDFRNIIRKPLNLLRQNIKTFKRSSDLKLYRKLYSAESLHHKRFYNIGAGDFYHPYWTNLDAGQEYYLNMVPNNNVSIDYNIFDKKPIPVEDGKAELLYCSHTIEHVDNISVEYLFRDCYRILKPGGVFRVICPDIDLAYKAWKNNNKDFFYWINSKSAVENFEKHCLAIPLSKASITQIFLEDFAAAASEIALVGSETRISDERFKEIFEQLEYEQALDYCISFCTEEMQRKFPFRHMNWFNQKKLTKLFRDAGFSDIRLSGYLQSTVPVLRSDLYFDQNMPNVSLFMEAIK